METAIHFSVTPRSHAIVIFSLLSLLVPATTPALSPAKAPRIPSVFLRPMDVATLAGRTVPRPARSVWEIPGVLAVMTPEFPHRCHLKLTSFNL